MISFPISDTIMFVSKCLSRSVNRGQGEQQNIPMSLRRIGRQTISHIHHHHLSRVLEEPQVGKRSHAFSRGTPSHREKAQLGTVLSFNLPSWFLLDVLSIRISDGVSIGCYLFFHLDTSPEGTLLCPGLS